MSGIDFSQSQIQSQLQIMSQKQIQSLELLSLASVDLREAVYKAAQENPALEITRDSLAQGQKGTYSSKRTNDFTHTSTSTSAAAREASDNFQAALEAKADDRQSLQEHLLMQLHLLHLNQSEEELGEKLIQNLDDKGCHILAPVSLLNKSDPLQTEKMLERVLKKIQSLDPVGVCVKNVEESLYVQAENSADIPKDIRSIVLFILNGHMQFLAPPQPSKVLKKIKSYFDESKNFPSSEATQGLPTADDFDEENIEDAINFIKTLDPFPARDFGSSDTHYVAPDIHIEMLPLSTDADGIEEDFAKGIVVCNNRVWNVRLSHDSLPQISVNKDFESFTEKSKISSDDKKMISSNIKKAQDFIEMLNYRQSTIQKACCYIVKKQNEFFAKGPGHLVPLKQQDIADEIGVHETTISRMANGKYIQCDWGLFEIKYFFTNAAATRTTPAAVTQADSGTDNSSAQQPAAVPQTDTGSSSGSTEISKEKVLHTIKLILEEHKNDKKSLSDQKLCDALAEKGIKIARRTVAKYRSQMNIESSYNR